MDSDDQNSNRKCDTDDNVLVEYNVNIADKINGNVDQQKYKNQYVDGNGNRVLAVADEKKGRTQNNENESEALECSCLGVTTAGTTTARNSNQTNSDNHIDEKIMKKLQAMSISDDDYGE